MDNNLIAYETPGCVIGTHAEAVFTLEFKEEAVRLNVDGGLTIAKVGQRLSVSQQTLRNRIKKHGTTGLKPLTAISFLSWKRKRVSSRSDSL